MKKQNLLFSLFLTVLLLTGMSNLNAAIRVVSNSDDTGAGSLRDAVSLSASGDTITFTASTNGNFITLGSEILIDKNLVIIGNDSSNTIIDGDGKSRIFQIDDDLLVTYSLTLIKVHLTNGNAQDGGAILMNDNDLIIDSSRFSANFADSSGGAIYLSGGDLDIFASSFHRNKANGNVNPQGGGAIFNEGGTIFMTNNTVFSANAAGGASGSGGAIFNSNAGLLNGSLTISKSTFELNSAKRAGGAIEDNVGAQSTFDVYSSTFLMNSVSMNPGNGGAIHITGAANSSFSASTFNGNTASAEGGALWNGSGTMTLDSVIVMDNTASGDDADQGGGGVYNLSGIVNISRNSVITDNTADGSSGSGGGILNDVGATLTVSKSTIKNNSSSRAGGGIEDNSGALTVVELTDVVLDSNTTASAPGNGGGLHITGPGNLNITRGTVIGNIASAEGGGLWNGAGTMNVDSVMITGNTASGNDADQGGGGIYSLRGNLNVTNGTEIKDNVADGTSGSGGGILLDSATNAIITDVIITNNTSNRAGGGIEDNSNDDFVLTLTDLILDNNSTGSNPGNGGGLHITGSGDVTILRGTVNGNDASREGGGLWNGSGTMTITDLTIDANTANGTTVTDGGGGIFNNGGDVVINTSTISNNEVDGASGNGGGIFNNGGSLDIELSTIANNSTLNNGGAIFNIGRTDINTSTIAENSATNDGGAFAQENLSDTVTFLSSIIAANTATTGKDIANTSGSVQSQGYNLLGEDDATVFLATTGDTVGTSVSPINSMLVSLADNGGLTFTMNLDCNSPALNAGDPNNLGTDQRDSVLIGLRDIGAYEKQDSCLRVGLVSNQLANLKGSNIYPNPISDGNLTIEIPSKFGNDNRLRVIEVATGKVIKEDRLQIGANQLATADYKSGIYLMQIIGEKGIETHRLIVSR